VDCGEDISWLACAVLPPAIGSRITKDDMAKADKESTDSFHHCVERGFLFDCAYFVLETDFPCVGCPWFSSFVRGTVE
jgi:hypothetical protein